MKLKPYAACQNDVLISPSILSADFAALGADIARVSETADTIHVDVMDGRFVPNLTIGMPVVKAIRPYTDLPIDCHLMIEDPARYVEAFAEAGADLITVHAETCPHLHRVTQQIRACGCGVGVVINPATSLSALEEILPEVDLVLLMSVNPGFGGQAYIESVTDKIRRLRRQMQERISKPTFRWMAVWVHRIFKNYGRQEPIVLWRVVRFMASPILFRPFQN